jgi:hypothetical protein
MSTDRAQQGGSDRVPDFRDGRAEVMNAVRYLLPCQWRELSKNSATLTYFRAWTR